MPLPIPRPMMPDPATIIGRWPAVVDRVLVTGSRTWPVSDTLLPDILGQLFDLAPEVVLVVGYDPVRQRPAGVDRIAYQFWLNAGGKVEPHPADWQRYGRGAGFRRNQEMVDSGADLCVAFIHDGSSGASHCAEWAEAAGIPVVRFTEPRCA